MSFGPFKITCKLGVYEQSPSLPPSLSLCTLDLVLNNLNGFGFVWFYGVSTIVNYLIPNPFLSIETVWHKYTG